MTLYFLDMPWVTYPRRDVVALLVQAIERIEAHLQTHEDAPMTRPGIEEYKNLRLIFNIAGYPESPARVMYSEMRDVLNGFSMKMAYEGFVRLSLTQDNNFLLLHYSPGGGTC